MFGFIKLAVEGLRKALILIKLDGKIVAQETKNLLKARSADFKNKHKRAVGLAVILIGKDPASQVYVKNKIKSCEESGIQSFPHFLPEDTKKAELESLIKSLNENSEVDGILLQLPLPKHLDKDHFIELISPLKDADGLGFDSLGRLWAGKPRVIPCTPKGVIRILKHFKIEIAGKRAVVIGRSEIVGKPMAQLLLMENATVTVCHSKTKDMNQYLKQAEIVVVAAGKARLLGKENFMKNSVVVDVGIHRLPDGKLCGDVKFEELEGHCLAATPVPGGVGPMTIAMLLENTVELAFKNQNS